RDLFREACIAEKHMSIAKVSLWRKIGKIASDWQEQLVLNLLLTDEINEADIEKLNKQLSGTDELPEGHTCIAKPHPKE
ncbi:MAG TPA: hypothetical protein VN247_00195, partial [Arenimonas sp.]|nr:hypothetical protein [Arenimonas sp.]